MVDVRNIEFPAMLKWKAISIVILALLSIWILNPFYTVDAGERAVVTWFGENKRHRESGIRCNAAVGKYPGDACQLLRGARQI